MFFESACRLSAPLGNAFAGVLIRPCLMNFVERRINRGYGRLLKYLTGIVTPAVGRRKRLRLIIGLERAAAGAYRFLAIAGDEVAVHSNTGDDSCRIDRVAPIHFRLEHSR